MSDHIAYNSFYSQLVGFSSVCSKFNDFDIRSRNLLESLLNRGFSKYRLKNSFKKFVLNHHDVLDIKYSMEEVNEFIRSHFSWIGTWPVQYWVSVFYLFCLFSQFCLVLVYQVSLVGRLLGCT